MYRLYMFVSFLDDVVTLARPFIFLLLLWKALIAALFTYYQSYK